jgi:hypothetical protein
MRTAVLMMVLGAWTLSGATCLPLIGNTSTSGGDPTTLAIVIQSPVSSTTVPQGATVPITWTAYNATGQPASVDVYVESRSDLTQTAVADDVALTAGSLTMTSDWYTAGLPGGEYVIYATLTAGSDTKTATAAGRITIDEFPNFEFTEPAENATFTQGGDALTISWNAVDPEGTGKLTIGLDSDADPESGNEIFIHEGTIGATEAEDSFDWSGKDLLGEDVAPGIYDLFALVSDEVNAEQAVEANVQITVLEEETPPEPEPPITLSIISPDEDTTFLTTDDNLPIEFGVNEFDNTLIDLKIDTDDNHSNGNEQTILAQFLVPGGTETDTFDWDGTLADGSPVADGIYRLFIVANTGGSTPHTAQSDGLIFRRSSEDQALVALLSPAQLQTVQAGSDVRITWRDDDPTDEATIRIVIDDDPDPAEAAETGADEIQIPTADTEFPASPDGVQDSFFYHVPGLDTLGAGTYYLFAYIGVTPEDPADPRVEQVSVAPAPLIVKDPTR